MKSRASKKLMRRIRRRRTRKVPTNKTLFKMIKARSPEVKFVDIVQSTATLVTSTPTIFDLGSNIIQGVNFNQRVGDRVRVLGVHLTMRWFGNAASASFTQQGRVTIARGISELTNGLANNTLFPAGAIGGATITYSPFNFEKHKSYKVYFDRMRYIASGWGASVPGFPTESDVRKYVKINRPLQYNNNTGTADDGGIYMFLSSDQATLSAYAAYYVRVYYIDA